MFISIKYFNLSIKFNIFILFSIYTILIWNPTKNLYLKNK